MLSPEGEIALQGNFSGRFKTGDDFQVETNMLISYIQNLFNLLLIFFTASDATQSL